MVKQTLEMPAWDLLARSPFSLIGLSDSERDEMVVSAVTLRSGAEEVLSRFKDQVWQLSPYIQGPGVPEHAKFIEWSPEGTTPELISDIKSVCLAWRHRGRNELSPPQWRTIRGIAILGITCARWLVTHGIRRFSDLRPLHLANYVHHCKHNLKLEPSGIRHRLEIIDLLWRFRADMHHPIAFQPWDGHSVTYMSGARFGFETARTPVIPRPVQEEIYRYCAQVLEQAETGLGNVRPPPLAPSLLKTADVVNVRDAMLYLVSITTGMRNDEVLRIEVGAFREEEVAGVTYRWVRTIEGKTGKGPVEYLCPEITGRALCVMEAWSAPFHDLLRKEIASLQAEPPSAKRDLRLQKAEADLRRVFLRISATRHWEVAAMTNDACLPAMRRLAEVTGVDWDLSPHQTRRTYARMIVESRMGRTSLIFLKWQLKHTSMTMTQGYASNPIADQTLFEDFLDEMTVFRSELLDSWTLETPLSGGAGRLMKELRATPHSNREMLLKSASESVHIRATGHGWCLAESQGCGGAGLYEATRCVDCRSGVIDTSFAETWREIHKQQLELLDLDDCGPAVRSRAEREVRLSGKVLADLGLVPLAS